MKLSFIYLAVVVLLFTSCKEDYYLFTDSEKGLFVYEKDNTICFQSHPSLDTLCFKVTDEINDTMRNSALGLQFHNNQIYELGFEAPDGSIGELFAIKNPDFMMSIIINVNNKIEFEGVLSDTLLDYSLNGIKYKEIYYFSNSSKKSQKLYYTKFKGIIYFENEDSGNKFTLLE